MPQLCLWSRIAISHQSVASPRTFLRDPRSTAKLKFCIFVVKLNFERSTTAKSKRCCTLTHAHTDRRQQQRRGPHINVMSNERMTGRCETAWIENGLSLIYIYRIKMPHIIKSHKFLWKCMIGHLLGSLRVTPHTAYGFQYEIRNTHTMYVSPYAIHTIHKQLHCWHSGSSTSKNKMQNSSKIQGCCVWYCTFDTVLIVLMFLWSFIQELCLVMNQYIFQFSNCMKNLQTIKFHINHIYSCYLFNSECDCNIQLQE